MKKIISTKKRVRFNTVPQEHLVSRWINVPHIPEPADLAKLHRSIHKFSKEIDKVFDLSSFQMTFGAIDSAAGYSIGLVYLLNYLPSQKREAAYKVELKKYTIAKEKLLDTLKEIKLNAQDAPITDLIHIKIQNATDKINNAFNYWHHALKALESIQTLQDRRAFDVEVNTIYTIFTQEIHKNLTLTKIGITENLHINDFLAKLAIKMNSDLDNLADSYHNSNNKTLIHLAKSLQSFASFKQLISVEDYMQLEPLSTRDYLPLLETAIKKQFPPLLPTTSFFAYPTLVSNPNYFYQP